MNKKRKVAFQMLLCSVSPLFRLKIVRFLPAGMNCKKRNYEKNTYPGKEE